MPKQFTSFALLIVTLCHAISVTASERLDVSLGTIAGDGWSLSGMSIAYDLKDKTARLSISQLQLPAPLDTVRNLTATCAAVEMSDSEFICRGGHFQLEHPLLGSDTFTGELGFDQHQNLLSFKFSELPIAHGKTSMQGHWQDGDWRLDGHATGLDLSQLKSLAATLVELPAGDATGRLDSRFRLSSQHDTLAGHVELNLNHVGIASDDGNIATEDLALLLVIDLQQQADGIRFISTMSSQHGQAYIAPVFIDATTHPLRLEANGHWNGADQDLQLTSLRLEQAHTLSAEAVLHWQAEQGLQDVQLLLHQATLPDAYEIYVQPFLIGTAADSLHSSGQISGSARYRHGQPRSLRLALTDIDLIDANNRYQLEQLNGVLHWQPEPEEARASSLRWQAAGVGPIALGSAALDLRLHGDNARLLKPLNLPILNGTLSIDTFQLAQLGTADRSAKINAELSPIALSAVSTALGWPEFSGTIAGRLPTVRYEQGRLSMDGRLDIEAFNGHIHIHGLQLNQPFGKIPYLSTNIELEHLDLKTLTDTFSFGRIEGLLDGRIEHLRLVNWQPASFTADFHTPLNDRSRHRISQRAIENLSSIGGGGAAGALSRGFLRFFKDFAYDRIGLSCRLQQNVCLMSGIGPADHGGYYIVRGKLLPRVDVIGFQHEVSWPTLIEQLKSVMQSEGPIVQ